MIEAFRDLPCEGALPSPYMTKHCGQQADVVGWADDDLYLPEPPEWHHQGACGKACRAGEADAGWWVPEQATPNNLIHQAIAICNQCPVLEVCREWGLRQPNSLAGVWGGMAQNQRKKLKRQLGIRAERPTHSNVVFRPRPA